MTKEVKLTGESGQETNTLSPAEIRLIQSEIQAINETLPVSARITSRLKATNTPFFSNDNISAFIKDGEIPELIDELAEKFDSVLRSLIIDVDNDPNSHDTGRRLAKMYVNELFEGRYAAPPKATAFPNEGDSKYEGMLVVRSEIKSVCSHHHQPVTGTAYIGIIPGKKVIGLSKYTRIAQHHARRGTLQEELCQRIQKDIAAVTETPNVAVYIVASHGCCENRGIMAKNSKTQTTVLGGDFKRSDLKQEFFDNIKLQSSGFSCE